MKKLITLGVLVLFAQSSFAQLKIAVISFAEAIGQSEEVQEEIEKMEERLKPEQEQVKAQNDEIIALQEKLRTDADVMSAEEKAEISREIEAKQFDLKQKVERLERQVQSEQEQLRNAMLPKVRAVVNDLIEIEGYDFVMERTTMFYANTKHDITRKVTEKLNERR